MPRRVRDKAGVMAHLAADLSNAPRDTTWNDELKGGFVSLGDFFPSTSSGKGNSYEKKLMISS